MVLKSVLPTPILTARWSLRPNTMSASMRGLNYGNCLAFIALAAFVLTRSPLKGQTKALLLFGGDDHKTFLGCLNCGTVNSKSVCNSIGHYGSSVSHDSIWNSVGPYGSSVSSTSPWNSISRDAPIIVDTDGNAYGYFTVNSVHHDRTRIKWLLAVLDYYEKTNDLDKTREAMCGE